MRRFYRLTDLDNGSAWSIPKEGYTENFALPYRTALLAPIGADGDFDLHSDLRAPLSPIGVTLDFLLTAASYGALQTAVDNMLAAVDGSVRTKGRRKLWRWEEADDSAPRWTYARPLGRPDIVRQPGQLLHQPVTLNLALPDPLFYDALTIAWLTANGYTAETLASGVVPESISPDYVFAVFTIAATPFTFTLTNAGDVESRHVIFRLASQGVNGFTNPKIENLTTAQEWSSTTDGTTASTLLSVHAAPGLGVARKSTNGGSSWVDDTPALALGSLQGVLMELQQGANSMRYTDGGTPNLKLLCFWRHAYRD